MNIHFYTIGVYGLTELEFFHILTKNKIDTFCDIRRRRAVRGSIYSFVNSNRLQNKLNEGGINYIYEIELSPTNEIRELQKKDDEANKIQSKQRQELGLSFKTEYLKKIISKFNFPSFIERLEKIGAKRVVLFCVEKYPFACHRSLVTNKLSEIYPDVIVKHLQ